MKHDDDAAETDEPRDKALEGLVMSMEPLLNKCSLDLVTPALASLIASAFAQQAETAEEHAELCDWLMAGLLEDRLSRYGRPGTSVQ